MLAALFLFVVRSVSVFCQFYSIGSDLEIAVILRNEAASSQDIHELHLTAVHKTIPNNVFDD